MVAKQNKNSPIIVPENDIYQSFRAISNYHGRDLRNLAPGISGRPGLTNLDYYSFRPDEEPCREYIGAMIEADNFYQNVGIVWNVINLMTDFTAKGIRIVHPQKRKEKLARDWFVRINGRHVTEKLVNHLYRLGNVVAFRHLATIKNQDNLAIAGKKEVPWSYVFLNPAKCTPLNTNFSIINTDKPNYGLKLDDVTKKQIKEFAGENSNTLPAGLTNLVNEGKDVYPLDPSRTIIYHFKKDDWRPWAYPLIHPIIDDLIVLEKLKLADKCALDSAANKIRILKLGRAELNIPPTKAASERLSQILEGSTGAGTVDIVWDDAISIEESNNDSYNFLGEEKYKPTLNNIYTGLGIPPGLTSNFTGGGASNNYINLKTLTERLDYGRSILIDFWQKELNLLAKALGWKTAPKIEFDQPILANEDVEKKLLLDLYDRNLISDEIIQIKFGLDPQMEKVRTQREIKERESGRRVKKAGPWFNPEHKERLTEIALQSGAATPSQVGLDFAKPSKVDLDIISLQNKGGSDPKSNPGIPGQGRPKLSTDKQKRKKPTFRPKVGASAMRAWANTAQENIGKVINPIFLAKCEKKNLRMLTEDEFNLLEKIKFDVLCCFNLYEDYNDKAIINKLSSGLYYKESIDLLRTKLEEFTTILKRSPNLDETRQIQVEVYLELTQNQGE